MNDNKFEDQKFINLLEQARETYGNGLRKQLFGDEKQDWVLRDIPWITFPLWDQLFEAIGDENWRFVSGTERGDWEGGPFRRASVFISPAGILNLGAWANKPTTEEGT